VAAKDWRTGPKQVWYYRSTDGGATWADGHIGSYPSELPNQSDPSLAFDTSGNLYLAVLAYNQNDFSIGGAYVARSTDKGATWETPIRVAANTIDVFNDKEWLTIDTSTNGATKGNLYVSWTLFSNQNTRNERAQIVVSSSTDGGKSFSPSVTVSLPSQTEPQGSYPVVGPHGELYVLYYNGSGGEDEDEDGGGAAGQLLRTQASIEALQQQERSLFIAKSTDGGQTFASPVEVTEVQRPPSPLPGSNFRMFVLPTLAVDPKGGALYATWNDYTSNDADVMLVTSTDGGQSWTQPKRVNDDAPQPRHDQFFPTAKVGPDGSLHMLWLDRRDDPANLRYAAYYARSTDGGMTFSKNTAISSATSDPSVGFQGSIIGDYIGLDLSADGSTVYGAWCDTREGTQDIYFSKFSTQTGPPRTPQPGNTSPTPVAVPSPQPLTGFTNQAFRSKWERADIPVARGVASRPWLWGPASFAVATEPYAQGSEGTREVQYFDKARMEINDPSANPSDPYYVTNGLLVVEMISGRVQTGDKEFDATAMPPSQVPVAGDINSPDALTYASLAPVASLNNNNRASNLTGQAVTATLNRSGEVGDDPARGGSVKISAYDDVLGHNIPDVFWSFMNATGPVYDARTSNYTNAPILNWTSDLGYPITEPYWTLVKIDGTQKWVLVQAFQRRVLTYVEDNAPGWQVEMGNVGRHYFDWRYKK